MASTLTRSDVNSGSAVDLGKVSGVTISKAENFVINPKILQESTETIVTSISGALKNVKIQGVITASSIANLKTAMELIEDFINGSQSAVTALSIDVEGTIMYAGNGIVQDFTWKYDISTRAVIDYSLSFVEGKMGG